MGAVAVCAVPGCDRPFHARGFCRRHHSHVLAGRDPLAEAAGEQFHTAADAARHFGVGPWVVRGWIQRGLLPEGPPWHAADVATARGRAEARQHVRGSSRPHGTASRYAYGCRCDRCRSAYNAASAERSRQRRERDKAERETARDVDRDPRLIHGTVGAWRAGCRCTECSTSPKILRTKAAAADHVGVSPKTITNWSERGLLQPEPPWTRREIEEAKVEAGKPRPSRVEHGTQTRYHYGCRCAECVKAYSEARSARRKRKRERDADARRDRIRAEWSGRDQQLCELVAAGTPYHRALDELGLTHQAVSAYRKRFPDWAIGLDIALVEGRDPGLAHGTWAGWTAMCRCPECRDYRGDVDGDTPERPPLDQAARRPTGSPLDHGTESRYSHRGCRCDLCRKAHADYQRGNRRLARTVDRSIIVLCGLLGTGVPYSEALDQAGISHQYVTAGRHMNPKIADVVDAALIKGRDPRIPHPSTRGWESGCRCPDCREWHM